MTQRSLLTFFALFISIACIAESEEDRTLSPYFFVEGDPAVDQLPLKDTRVKVTVSGLIADVQVVQIYENHGGNPINARYIFPASTRAAVYSMQMRIGNEIITARVREKQQAKQEFVRAKKAGKSASLLEQSRPNVFSMSIANIMPGDRIEIDLRYTELLISTDGIYEFVYPTVVGPRYPSRSSSPQDPENEFVHTPYLPEAAPPKTQFHLAARINAPVPIQFIKCSSHPVLPLWTNQNSVNVQIDDADAFQGNRDFVLRYRLNGEEIGSGLMLYEDSDEKFFLFMAQPPYRVDSAAIPPREYIFVVDVSGSMHGFPLNTAKALLRDLIRQLRPTDFINVVLFAGSSTVMSPQSLPATRQNLESAVAVIDSQSGGGGTELLSAVQRALRLPRQQGVSRSTILVTDGFISAEKEVFAFIRDHLSESNVFAFGIGSSVNRYLIEGVAKAGMGEPFVVLNPQEAPGLATQFREYIEKPVLSGIRLKWSGFDAYDIVPEQIPDLFATRPIVVFGKYHGSVTGSLELSGMTGLGPYHAVTETARIRPDAGNVALRYLWARSQIAELSDYGSNSVGPENIARITSIGLTYNLLTQYTSFIAVHEVIRNPNGSARDVKQPLSLPQGVSHRAVGGTVSTQNEPGVLTILLLVAFAMATGRMLRWRKYSSRPQTGRV